LRSGDWVGLGAERFFQEMHDLVMPGMNRLISGLKDASNATRKISDALREAEADAGALFRGGSSSHRHSHKPENVPAPTTDVKVVGSKLDADVFDKRRLPYKIGKPTDVAKHAFYSGKADALKYKIEIDGQTIDVYYPKTLDPKMGHFHTVDEIAKGLAALPKVTRELVVGVNVNPGHDPDDKDWANQDIMPKNARAYMAGGEDGVIEVFPTKNAKAQSYLDGTMIHESGHILTEQQWGSDDTKGADWKQWSKAIAADKNQVSRYGTSSPNEDFSEAFQQYITYKGTKYEADARKLWPNRFAIIDKLVR